MRITVCIGSSCHIKGSRQVVEQLQYLINKNNLKEEVELKGTFCTGQCQIGVAVTIDDQIFSVLSNEVESFFEREVLSRVNK